MAYGYDDDGNRTDARVPLRGIDTTQSAQFDTEGRSTHVGDATYTYTPDGYLALKHSPEGTTTYAYTAFDEPILMKNAPGTVSVEERRDGIWVPVVEVID